ncbi:hypothetical protein METBIDRAFT_35231 [Metschnikowia bicuspidata var. bicuspidata NRRL YB-4993]|uniref:Transcription factor MBP1 n=1 Tax=Metschnikowia bicuspidata var. bicuspidata NRRL YB-4993 TaxID=869754 RepID=A0A1A0HH19_9ASCO|nr:hypothetical protein METBIDRAFT_35231 [Metschnikowia bicuspidata var. bicuspidata NRRL YB-4993]OBA23474.1 hypothetical protein METBIDRAFT_35231 [Metschnikowia bicuspidata var. bicuspidata NRRL YB-4993]
MAPPLLQIYSATYSNVPVFEFVTPEGPIMRRKLDSWINATHILKIAKFPKARRTRILEKDIQTGIHDKVQGGYGKYQGTYVPLDIGTELARNFGVYELLQPIFDFVYVEGRLETPPPAPKHNHASALNIARRQMQQQQKLKRETQAHSSESPASHKRMKLETNAHDAGRPTAQDKPRRVALSARENPPPLAESHTRDSSFSVSRLPPLLRQDTERDALLIMASNMNVRQADLEVSHSDDETPARIRGSVSKHDPFNVRESDDDEFMSGKELFGSRAFVLSHNLHGRTMPSLTGSPERAHQLLSLNGSVGRAHGVGLPGQSYLKNTAEDAESAKYFDTLLEYLMEDSSLASPSGGCKPGSFELPEKILHPPQPLLKININRPVDEDGNTVFHWACSMANMGIIEFLLSIFPNFIDSGVTNYNGETPLMFLVQFRNSYQLNNFPVILDMLFDSFLSVDKLGRTVLHHIALACDLSKFDNSQRNEPDLGFKARKERFVSYYFEIIFSKIVGFPDYQLLHGDEKRSLEEKKELIFKFVNHQDNNGNTAFHIVAHNMSKKCIKTFICFHKFIDLSLRNHVNYSVEDYLASHNYLLRLESDNGSVPHPSEKGLVSSHSIFPMEHTQSFETQLHKTRMAMNYHNTSINLVTEKLSELSYCMENELKQKDNKLDSLYRYFRIIGLEKFKSQEAVLQLFNLGYLVEDIAKDYGASEDCSQLEAKADTVILGSGSRDKVIQEEVSRLMNDLIFQKISAEEELLHSLTRYKYSREKATQIRLKDHVKVSPSTVAEPKNIKTFQLAVSLQNQVLRRKLLANKLYEQEARVPLFAANKDEFKENRPDITGRLNLPISEYPSSDKLHKYCKLVALSCGMSMTEAENSIDLIEQSLAKNNVG